MDEQELLRRYNSFYLSVLMRYKEYIEQSESIYLPDMPKLIEPESSEVRSFSLSIKNEFDPYSFKDDFFKAAQAAFQKLDKIVFVVQLPIQFWQTTSETLLNGVGDTLDYYSLFCSILIALGGVSSKVLVMTGDDKTTLSVYSETEMGILLFQRGEEIKNFKETKLMLEYLIEKNGNRSTAYEFNDKIYRDLS